MTNSLSIPDDLFEGLVENQILGSLFSLLEPPEDLTNIEWITKYRVLAQEAAEKSGSFDVYYTPYFVASYILLDEKYKKHVLVWMKPAQCGFTEFENNLIGKIIHQRRGNLILGFPRESSAKSYYWEKFIHLINSTPELSAIFKGEYSLKRQSWSQPRYEGGFIKFITAGSASAQKSTSAQNLMQEEPDDVGDNKTGQGNGLSNFIQRLKTFSSSLFIFGGTPTISGESNVEDGYELSSQGVYLVPCHACREFHEMQMENLYAPLAPEGLSNAVEGYDVTKTTYVCPKCDTHWDFEQKNKNVRNALNFHFYGWVFKFPDRQIVGFRISELLAPFAGSSFQSIYTDKLQAEAAYAKGRPGKLISFVNNREGLPYKDPENLNDVGKLAEGALPYQEGTVPLGGLVLTAGVDVQHDRFSIGIRAWGRNRCSWLVAWVEIFGYLKNPNDPAWRSAENYIFKNFPSEANTATKKIYFPVSAVNIDTGDGGMSSLLYDWIARLQSKKLPAFATKGASDVWSDREIYTIPSNSKSAQKDNIASRFGILPYLIGTNKAKAEIYRRLSLDGDADRMYAYRGVRPDYWEQLTSNIPKRRKNRIGFTLPAGKRDEALDCEVMCLHGAYRLHIFYWGEEQWKVLEQKLIQTSLETSAQNKSDDIMEKNTYGGFE